MNVFVAYFRLAMVDRVDLRLDGNGVCCDPFCEPCRTRKGFYVKPYGYCHECYKFICPTCHAKHSKLKRTKGHTIKIGKDMPQSMAAKPPKYDKCDIHSDILKDQFCEEHTCLVCTSCILFEHKLCSVTKVADLCKNIKYSEIKSLHGIVNAIHGNLKNVIASVEENDTKLKEGKQSMLCEVESMYTESLSKLAKIYDNVKKDIESQYNPHLQTISELQKTLKYHCKSFETSVKDTKQLIGSVVNEKAFLKMHEVSNSVDKYTKDVQDMNQSQSFVSLSFELEETLSAFLARGSTFGSIKVSYGDSNILLTVPEKVDFPGSSYMPQANLGNETSIVSETTHTSTNTGNTTTSANLHVQDQFDGEEMQLERFTGRAPGNIFPSAAPVFRSIMGTQDRRQSPGYEMPIGSKLDIERDGCQRVRLPEDDRVCNISGMALTNDDKLIIVDNGNRKLKVFTRAKLSMPFSLYDEYIKFVACVNLPVRPRDIAVIHNDEVVVTTDKNSIVIIDVSLMHINSSPIMEIVKLPFGVRGIAKYRFTLLVTCPYSKPPSVKRIDQAGSVYWSVSSNWLVKQLFYKPRYVCCHKDTVIVTDWNNCITLLHAQTGEVIKRQNTKKNGPKCISTDSEGRIYLYYKETSEVVHIAGDLSSEQTLKVVHPCQEPQAMIYDDKAHKLIVSYCDTDFVEVFRIFKTLSAMLFGVLFLFVVYIFAQLSKE